LLTIKSRTLLVREVDLVALQLRHWCMYTPSRSFFWVNAASSLVRRCASEAQRRHVQRPMPDTLERRAHRGPCLVDLHEPDRGVRDKIETVSPSHRTRELQLLAVGNRMTHFTAARLRKVLSDRTRGAVVPSEDYAPLADPDLRARRDLNMADPVAQGNFADEPPLGIPDVAIPFVAHRLVNARRNQEKVAVVDRLHVHVCGGALVLELENIERPDCPSV